MGNKSFKDPNVSDQEIKQLEEKIKDFIDSQKQDIEAFFKNKKQEKKKIGFQINDNNEITTDSDEVKYLEDYVIKKTWNGNNRINTTKCYLSIFNIGYLLGKDGLLYSICMFYYCFLNFKIEEKTEKEIRKEIDNCLSAIDQGNSDYLNNIWKIKLDKGKINDLRLAKYTLGNLFEDGINDIIYNKIHNRFLRFIAKFCHSSRQKINKFCCIIFYLFGGSLKEELKNRQKRNEANYIKEKNLINNKKILDKLIEILTKDAYYFFKYYNLFILALDDNSKLGENCGATFMGYPLKGLGSFGRAKRLIEKESDGFQTADPEEKQLYDFYQERIEDIKNFFKRNEERIKKINEQFKGNNLFDIENTLKEVTEDAIQTSRKYDKEGITETTQDSKLDGIKESNARNGILITNDSIQNNIIENNNSNFCSQNCNYFNSQSMGMDPEQYAWYLRLLREQKEDEKIQEREKSYQRSKNNYIEVYKEEVREPLMESSFL